MNRTIYVSENGCVFVLKYYFLQEKGDNSKY